MPDVDVEFICSNFLENLERISLLENQPEEDQNKEVQVSR